VISIVTGCFPVSLLPQIKIFVLASIVQGDACSCKKYYHLALVALTSAVCGNQNTSLK